MHRALLGSTKHDWLSAPPARSHRTAGKRGKGSLFREIIQMLASRSMLQPLRAKRTALPFPYAVIARD
jgi:hypothetical protein